MKLVACAALIALAAPRRAQPPPPPPPIPLPSLPVLTRLVVDGSARADRVIVDYEFLLDKGDYQSGDLSLYVAYGAPGVPLVFDAHVRASIPASDTLPGFALREPAVVEPRPRKPPGITWVVGREHQAGAVVRVPASLLKQAWSTGPLVLGLRAVHAVAATNRDIVVRLGTVDNQPITVQRIDVAGSPNATARACRTGALGEPVILHDLTSGRRLDASDARDPALYYRRVAPSQLQRAAEDDLCVGL